jgi:hypothetical protein
MSKPDVSRVVLNSVAAFLVAAAITIFGLVYTGSTTHADSKTKTVEVKPDRPILLDGQWHQVSGMDGVEMSATIYGNSIQVDMKLGNQHGIFWMGSFDTSDKHTQSFSVDSIPDSDAKKAVHNSLYGTSEGHKVFNYDAGDLSFEFSMMGVESTIHLSRGDK